MEISGMVLLTWQGQERERVPRVGLGHDMSHAPSSFSQISIKKVSNGKISIYLRFINHALMMIMSTFLFY